MDTFIIRLEDIRFFSYIGVAEQERTVGNEFSVEVSVEYDASMFKREDLSSTISYAEIYDVTKSLMSESWLLLESVAVELADRLCDKWPVISKVKVRITKLSAPITGLQGKCSVKYIKTVAP